MKRTGRKYQTKIDWAKALIYYCTPDEKTGRLKSYVDVAKHFGVSTTQVDKMGKKYNWVNRREEFGKKRLEVWIAEKEENIKKIEQRQFSTWQESVELMEKQLAQLRIRQSRYEYIEEILDELFDELARTTKKSDRREVKKKIANVMQQKVYAKELRDTMEALKTSMNGLRITMGMPTEISKADVTNTNKEVPLSEEELEKMDEDFKKADEDKKTN